MAEENVIRIVAALVFNEDGETLLVRKRGTPFFMQPGGKLANGEKPLSALEREIREELGCGVKVGTCQSLGHYRAAAANEPDCTVMAELFVVGLDGKAKPQAEIEEVIWIDPTQVEELTLAPLTAIHVMPLARDFRGCR